MGTLVGQFITNFSHVKVVVQKYSIPEKATSFTVRQTIWPVLLLLEMGMAYYIFKDKLGIVSLPSLILKVVVWGAFGAANFLILWFFPGHKEFRRYCKRFFRAMLHDIKKQEKYGK